VSQVNPETVDLSISVKDDQDSPVSGATVSIDEISSTTGSAGGCTLSNVPTGIQTITVTKEGYDEYSDSITVSTENISFDIILTPTG